jgi:NADH-quinone oxidoreductase subunit D
VITHGPFDDREDLDLLEALPARATYCYYRVGGLYNDVDEQFITGTGVREAPRPD